MWGQPPSAVRSSAARNQTEPAFGGSAPLPKFTSPPHSPLCRLRYIIAKPLLQELFPATRRTFQCELADVTAKGRRGLIFSNECPCGSSKSTRDSERSFVPV